MAAALPLAAQAPAFDTSGNSMLKGTYYFRYVLYGISTQPNQFGITGDINEAISLYGNITFDGNGNYSITNSALNDGGNNVTTDPLPCYLAQLSQSQCPSSTQNQAVAGTYSISASGYGFLLNPVTGEPVYGLVAANGIFSGSTTEAASLYNDLFLASPLPSPALTNFSGSYNVVGYLPGGDFAFPMSPNGSGSLGTVNISGYVEGSNTQPTQSSNVTYRFSNGAAVLTFPNSNTANFISGLEFIYFSPDGQFFFGGSNVGFDMIMGVANKSGDGAFGACSGGTSCLFYGAGIDQNVSALGNGFADLDGYFGAFNTTNTGAIIGHQRVSDLVFYNSTYGFIYSDTFKYPVSGAYTDNTQSFNFWVGDGGSVRIGEGISPFLGITVAFQAPALVAPPGSVYINPAGIVNAASFAPFTAGLANGEFISIFGTNLSSKTVVSSTVPYPTQLNNVQVLINGVASPLYFVSAGQVAALVPSGNPFALAQVQVNNNGTLSNVVTMPLGAPGATPATITSPGVYNYPPGSGFAAAVDANTAKIVTTSSPANPGDTIEVFLSGLGAVFPTVADGAPAPGTPPLSQTVNTVTADVDGTTATVSFAGLAPTLAGLYQVNVTIPANVPAGNHFLDFSVSNPNSTNQFNLEAFSQQVLIPIGGGAAARITESAQDNAAPRARAKAPVHPQPTRKPFCAWNCSAPRP